MGSEMCIRDSYGSPRTTTLDATDRPGEGRLAARPILASDAAGLPTPPVDRESYQSSDVLAAPLCATNVEISDFPRVMARLRLDDGRALRLA